MILKKESTCSLLNRCSLFLYLFIWTIPMEFLQIIVSFVYASSFYYCEHSCSFGLTDAATNDSVLVPFIYETMNE